jgi:mRNA-degrading endonuclease RelE of RelBE toxin-antitoxin system
VGRRLFSFDQKFIRSLRELPHAVHAKLAKCLELFERERRHPGLHVEPLSGRAEGLYSARVDGDYRLIFSEPAENQVFLLFVGKHEDAYREADRISTPHEPQIGIALSQPSTPDASRSVFSEPSLIAKLSSLRMKKYLPLAEHLQGVPRDVRSVDLTFEEIAEIIRDDLPDSALQYSAWWANDPGRHVQASAWLSVGWKTGHLELKNRRVTFSRMS